MKVSVGNETFENVVATFVDIGSIIVAYAIGVNGYGLVAGLGYAMFDAFLVVWMRKRIVRLVRWASPWKRHRSEQAAPQQVYLTASCGAAGPAKTRD